MSKRPRCMYCGAAIAISDGLTYAPWVPIHFWADRYRCPSEKNVNSRTRFVVSSITMECTMHEPEPSIVTFIRQGLESKSDE